MHLPPHFAVNQAQPVIREYAWELSGLRGAHLVFDSGENSPRFPAAATAAKSLQSCLTLCDPINGSPPGSPVPGILQARTLEWVAISFSNAQEWKEKGESLSRVQLFTTPWTAAHQAPPSMGFSRQEYWSGVPLPWTLLICLLHLSAKECGNFPALPCQRL